MSKHYSPLRPLADVLLTIAAALVVSLILLLAGLGSANHIGWLL